MASNPISYLFRPEDTLLRELGIMIKLDRFHGTIWHGPQCPHAASSNMIKQNLIEVPIYERTLENTCVDWIETTLFRYDIALPILVLLEDSISSLDKFADEYFKDPQLYLHLFSILEEGLNTRFRRVEDNLQGSKNLAAPLVGRIQSLLASEDDVKARLRAIKRGPVLQEAIKLKSELLELHGLGSNQEDNTAPVLVGMANFDAIPPGAVRVILESYSIFEGPGRIASVMPRYAHKCLLSLDHGARADLLDLMSSSSKGISEEVCYTAVRLWDPDGSGPLRDISVAVESAKAL